MQQAVIDELRLCAGGAAPTMRELRLAVDCSAAELAAAVQSLRYQGKLEWDRLELRESMKSAGAPPAAEGAGDDPARHALASPGPDDEDDDERPAPNPYPTETNDEAIEGPARNGPVPAEGPPGDGADAIRHEQPAVPVGRVEEPRPDPAGDQRSRAPRAAEAAGGGPKAVPPVSGGFVPKALLHQAGIHAAQTRAASRPVPAPEHEPEIARLVREEATEVSARRHRASSTGTVRQPLELRKFGIADLSLAEGIATMLAEEPHDLVVAIARKHPKLWRRIVLLGRARGEQPAQALYAVLEAGLDELEPQQEQAA